jgi:hypothetical protein
MVSSPSVPPSLAPGRSPEIQKILCSGYNEGGEGAQAREAADSAARSDRHRCAPARQQGREQEDETHPPGATTHPCSRGLLPAIFAYPGAQTIMACAPCLQMHACASYDLGIIDTGVRIPISHARTTIQCVGSLPATPDLADEMNRVEVQCLSLVPRTVPAFT